MEAVGLQTHIWNNNLRSGFLLAGFPVLLLVIVYFLTLALVGDPIGAAQMMLLAAPAALLVSAVWFVIAYFSAQTIIDLATGARKVERRDAPELYNLLENLAIQRGMKTPQLRIIESEGMNAFATGLHEGQYSVTVTRGLLDALDHDEVEAVLAHELTHIVSKDVRTMVIASVFAGIITLIAQVLFRVMAYGGGFSTGRNSREKGGGGGVLMLVALGVAAVGWLLAVVIRMALSRSREFVADAGAVDLTRNPDAMISALQKISGNAHLDAPDSVRSMFIENVEEGVMGLFATHPPIPRRIEALVRYAGGREGIEGSTRKVAVPVSEGPSSDDPIERAIYEAGEAGPAEDPQRPGPWG